MEIRKSQRKESKMKLCLQGPSGSGKTYSALLMAYGICNDWNKITVIDTENHSADLYSHLGSYNVLDLSAPYSPERYIEAITLCEQAGSEVIIIDSMSAEWEGTGGILEIHSTMPDNSFTNWSRITPRHNYFVQKIIQSESHIITTVRTKQDYVLNEKNGKNVPEKVGLKSITREGMDYEFTVVLDIDIKHNAICSKDRTGLFMDKPPFVISENTGGKIWQWCNMGATLKEVEQKIEVAKDINELIQIYSDHPEFRNNIKSLLTAKKTELEGKLSLSV